MGKKNNSNITRRKRLKQAAECSGHELSESDHYFSYIAGYTSNGFAYGITWEQKEELDRAELKLISEEELADYAASALPPDSQI